MMSRQLDVAIAEALGCDNHLRVTNRDAWLYHVPYYSTDGNAMLELDDKMRKRGGELDELYYDPNSTRGKWYVLYGGRVEENGAFAETESLARALAAYQALTGNRWELSCSERIHNDNGGE